MDVTLPDKVKTKSQVTVLSGHFDLPGRAGVLEQVTHTGHDCCSYCTEHGEVIKTGPRGHVMTFPFRNSISGHAKLRTAEEVESNSYDALERNKTVSNLLLTGSNKHYFVSGKRLISLRGLTEKCSRQFEVVITDRIPFV